MGGLAEHTHGYVHGGLVTFQTDNIFPPSALYVGENDTIDLMAWCSQPNTNVRLALRFLSPEGEIIPERYDFQPTSDRALNSFRLQHAEGFLLSASVYTTAGVTTHGQCFARLKLVRGSSGDSTDAFILCSGYVAPTEYASWPGGRCDGPLDGRGACYTLSVADPAAGQPVIYTVPAGVSWLLRSVVTELQSSATAGNRQLFCTVDNGTWVSYTVWSPVTQAASLLWGYYMVGGYTPPVLAGASNLNLPLAPEIRMQPGWRIIINALNLAAGDQFSLTKITVEEWLGQ